MHLAHSGFYRYFDGFRKMFISDTFWSCLLEFSPSPFSCPTKKDVFFPVVHEELLPISAAEYRGGTVQFFILLLPLSLFCVIQFRLVLACVSSNSSFSAPPRKPSSLCSLKRTSAWICSSVDSQSRLCLTVAVWKGHFSVVYSAIEFVVVSYNKILSRPSAFDKTKVGVVIVEIKFAGVIVCMCVL